MQMICYACIIWTQCTHSHSSPLSSSLSLSISLLHNHNITHRYVMYSINWYYVIHIHWLKHILSLFTLSLSFSLSSLSLSPSLALLISVKHTISHSFCTNCSAILQHLYNIWYYYLNKIHSFWAVNKINQIKVGKVTAFCMQGSNLSNITIFKHNTHLLLTMNNGITNFIRMSEDISLLLHHYYLSLYLSVSFSLYPSIPLSLSLSVSIYCTTIC